MASVGKGEWYYQLERGLKDNKVKEDQATVAEGCVEGDGEGTKGGELSGWACSGGPQKRGRGVDRGKLKMRGSQVGKIHFGCM